MKITFYGGVGEVTGSRHLIDADGTKILMDSGMFQGHRQEAIDKNKNIPFKPQEIAHVLLSHAHIDHSGNLPSLTKNGYGARSTALPRPPSSARSCSWTPRTCRKKTPNFSIRSTRAPTSSRSTGRTTRGPACLNSRATLTRARSR
ncbi:MAG: MBL fold metallo-hydrolase [Elusimicrobia bacterium]|nr:MBL fold metallo-hydrolase [Elusimicrobiota bacterium]